MGCSFLSLVADLSCSFHRQWLIGTQRIHNLDLLFSFCVEDVMIQKDEPGGQGRSIYN